MTECIHGLDEGLCSICFPKEEPKTIRPAASATRTRTPRAAAGERSPRAARGPEQKPFAPFGARRIHHVTALRNLEAILLDEAITAGATPELDLLTPEARRRRDDIELVPGTGAGEFVPFSLSPNASWWDDLLAGRSDDRWSRAARSTPGTQFVQLIGTVSSAGGDVAVSDGDVTGATTRFGLGFEAAGALVRRVTIADPELRSPEVLVRGKYALSDVVLIAAPNEPVRDRVKALLREYGVQAPKIVAYPPWFQPVESEEL